LNDYLRRKKLLLRCREAGEKNEEQRKRALNEIFHYYTGQHFKWNMCFDQLLEKKHKLDFGEFNVFCRDFRVPLAKTKI